jgi:hypothetical protein
MPTPMFKVLAQSLRLGQPPDATTAVRVLVEVLEKQQTEIEDLKSKLSIATSRIQYAEARLARVMEAAEGGAPREAEPPPSHGRPASAPPRAPEPARGSQRPPPIPASPMIPKAPRMPSNVPPPSIVDDGFEEFNQTLVIDKRDVAAIVGAEAPFPLAPASERPRAMTRAENTPFHPQQAPAANPEPEPRSRSRQAREAENARVARISDPETNAMPDDLPRLVADAVDDATETDRTAKYMLVELAGLQEAAARASRKRNPEGG